MEKGKQEERKATLWIQRLSPVQAMLVTLLIFVTMTAYTLCYLDEKLIPQTGVIVRVKSGVNGRTGSVNYHLEDKAHEPRSLFHTIPPVFGNLTAQLEQKSLGLSEDTEHTHTVVSFYATEKNLNQYPVGLRLGVNNYPKDFWYYWTLFSRVAHNGVFILLSAAIAFICTCFKKEGTSAKTRYTCYAFTLFWVYFWFFIF